MQKNPMPFHTLLKMTDRERKQKKAHDETWKK
jgi:hypothetical protein